MLSPQSLGTVQMKLKLIIHSPRNRLTMFAIIIWLKCKHGEQWERYEERLDYCRAVLSLIWYWRCCNSILGGGETLILGGGGGETLILYPVNGCRIKIN